MKSFRVFFRALAVTLCLGAVLALAGQAQAADPDPAVKLETSMGDIIVRLDSRKAPISTANFVQYVKSGFYDGTVFHRVIKNFMIQGGGMGADMKQKPSRASIRNEADNGLKNKKYTIAMARTGNPNSATSQFFINVKDNDNLNAPQPDGHGYTVFGKVVSGTEVVDKIKAVATGNKGMHQNVPATPVTITTATLVK